MISSFKGGSIPSTIYQIYLKALFPPMYLGSTTILVWITFWKRTAKRIAIIRMTERLRTRKVSYNYRNFAFPLQHPQKKSMLVLQRHLLAAAAAIVHP